MSGRTALTELGPDLDALRTRDRGAILFDLGLGTLQVDACMRVSDADAVAALRSRTGHPCSRPKSRHADHSGRQSAPRLHQPYRARRGIPADPAAGWPSPDGPHTHVLPKLLAHRRTHAATEPLPECGPLAHLYPAHPLRDQLGRKRAFRPDHHAAFQALLELYGLPELTACKRAVVEAVAKGRGLRW